MSNSNKYLESLDPLNMNKLQLQLRKFSSITEQLDYFKRIKKQSSVPLEELYGVSVFTSLIIPEPIYLKFIQPNLKDPELTNWFLRYNASLILDQVKTEKKIPQKLQSPLRDTILQGEIKKIQGVEDRAEQLLIEGTIDVYGDPVPDQYQKEVEFLRIKTNYYQVHPLPSIDSNQSVVYTYAIHILLKLFLEKELQQFTADILDVIALQEIEKSTTEFHNVKYTVDKFLNDHDDHGLKPFKENRQIGLPVFKPSVISSLTALLEPYFSEQDISDLETLFATAQGGNHKLVFLSEGNKLADLFWQLYQQKMVFNCNKSQLEKWIASHFKYTERKSEKDFTLKYLNKIISTDHQSCKNPIARIIEDPFTQEKLLKHT